ncbi:MAG: acyl-CoA dehydrogenase family protein [Myxococcales bacterium]|nr:acyl-CoA dehydrogenase family protein [Myxococcales bacterium]
MSQSPASQPISASHGQQAIDRDSHPFPTREELIERARDLAPTLRERAGVAAKLRRMPQETMDDFHRLGFFKVVQPKRYGGYEMDPSIIFDLQLELGRGCASSAWVYGVLNVHTWQLALFAPEAQDEVWKDAPTTLISSSYMPVAKTEWVDGGVKLSGRWSFSSGCDYAEWAFLGGFVPTEEGKAPDMRTFLVPRSDYDIIDNWHTSGLRGSGSKDVVVENVFVPDHRMHKFLDGFQQDSPGNEVNRSPVYRYPFGQIHVRSVSTPAVGAAFGALDAYLDYMKSKVSQATGGKAKDSFTNSVTASDASALLDREVLVLRRNFQEMFSYLEKGEKIPIERRVRFRNDSARAVDAATQVVEKLFLTCGARAVLEDHPLNRHFQDIHAIRLHHANGPDGPAANFGGVLFGAKNTDFFI